TATQRSGLFEYARVDRRFTEPVAWECLIRGWHREALAVRREHRMIAHTCFLATTRRLAPEDQSPLRRRWTAPGAYAEEAPQFDEADLAADLGERTVSEKKLRKLRRSFEATRALREGSASGPDGADGPD